MIQAVKGNEYALLVQLKRLTSTGTEAINMSALTRMEIALVNSYGERYVCTPGGDTTSTTTAVATCDTSGLTSGVYDMEMTCRINGYNKRGYTRNVLNIEYGNTDSTQAPETYDGKDAYSVDMIIP